jgi:hypothetical protein
MAIVQGIPVRGVFFCYDPSKWESARAGRFCVPISNNDPYVKGDYLQSAAGAGAEMLFFNQYNRGASEDDRRMFSATGAPDWEATVAKSKQLLAAHLKVITEMSDAIIEAQKVSMNLWPDFGMSGSSMRFKQILSDEEVRQIADGDPNWGTLGTDQESPGQPSAASLARRMRRS